MEVLNMISELSKNEKVQIKIKSAFAMEVVLKKVSGIVVWIACSGVVGLHNASMSQQSHTNLKRICQQTTRI
jgi:hypothetical protein